MHDAVDWKIIDENPFCKVRTQRSTVKVNVFVPREVVDKLMKKANPVWQVLGKRHYLLDDCSLITVTGAMASKSALIFSASPTTTMTNP